MTHQRFSLEKLTSVAQIDFCLPLLLAEDVSHVVLSLQGSCTAVFFCKGFLFSICKELVILPSFGVVERPKKTTTSIFFPPEIEVNFIDLCPFSSLCFPPNSRSGTVDTRKRPWVGMD